MVPFGDKLSEWFPNSASLEQVECHQNYRKAWRD